MKSNRTKLFVAVAALAMLACAIAIALPASETDAAVAPISTPSVDADHQITADTDISALTEGVYVLSEAVEINKKTTIAEGVTIYTDGKVLSVTGSAVLTLNGTIYVNGSNGGITTAAGSNFSPESTGEIRIDGNGTVTLDVTAIVGPTSDYIKITSVGKSTTEESYVSLSSNGNAWEFGYHNVTATITDVNYGQYDTVYIDENAIVTFAVSTNTEVKLGGPVVNDGTAIFSSAVIFDDKDSLVINNGTMNIGADVTPGTNTTTTPESTFPVVFENTGVFNINAGASITGTIKSGGADAVVNINDATAMAANMATVIEWLDNDEDEGFAIVNNMTTTSIEDFTNVPQMERGTRLVDTPSGMVLRIYEFTDNSGTIGVTTDDKKVQYGLYIDPVQYTGKPFSDVGKVPNGIVLDTVDGSGYEDVMFNQSGVFQWVDDETGERYAGSTRFTDAGEYTIYWEFTIHNATKTYENAREYIDFIVEPQIFETTLSITGWAYGSYDETKNSPVHTPALPAELADKVTYEYFTSPDTNVYVSQGDDPSVLTPGKYYVRATIADSGNIAAEYSNSGLLNDSGYVEFTVTTGPSELIFHGLDELKGVMTEEEYDTYVAALLESLVSGYNTTNANTAGFEDVELTLEDLQKVIRFMYTGEDIRNDTLNYTITGKTNLFVNGNGIYEALAAYWTENGTNLEVGNNTTVPTANTGSGYFVVFYVEATGEDLSGYTLPTDKDTLLAKLDMNGLTTDTVSILDITPADLPADEKDIAEDTLYNETAYRYYIMYVDYLAAESFETPGDAQAAYDAGYTGDYGEDWFDAKYTNGEDVMNYHVTLTYLNYIGIILYDNSTEDLPDYPNYDGVYNHTQIYWYKEGAYFKLPGGAYDGFKNWISEKTETEFSERTFANNSVIVVSELYDGNGDYRIDLVAVYGAATGGDDNTGDDPVTPDDPVAASDVMIFIAPAETGANIMLYGVGGYVPECTVTVTYSYVINVAGVNYAVEVVMEAQLVQNADGLYAVLLPVDLSAEENYATINSIYATLTVGGESTVTNSVAFSAPATA